MFRNTRFTARFSAEDQALLVHIAASLQRSKSDTVRFLLYEKAAELGLRSGQASTYLPPYGNERTESGGNYGR